MVRCLELAILGAGNVAPNPMVGCVIIHRGRIIGEGYHRNYGGPHAEVNAIASVKDQDMLKESTLYVNLEPCAHYGQTPPCSNLIIEKGIPEVVIGTIDPFAEVAGKGIEKLLKAGIQVQKGVMEDECREVNKKFFLFHEKKRPYIILKWAQTADGFIDVERLPEGFGNPTWITGDLALRLVHKIRTEEEAILVGTATAEKDNPSLTARHWPGRNPMRILIDKNLRLKDKGYNLYDRSQPTIVFNAISNLEEEKLEFVKINFNVDILPQMMETLYRKRLLSLIVEGGQKLLQSFIDQNIWDEAYIFRGDKLFFRGITAPRIKGLPVASEHLNNDSLTVLKNFT